MSTLSLPGPKDPNTQSEAGEGSDNAEAPKKSRNRRSKKSQVPDVETCLNAQGSIPGLIAMHVITTAQANSLQRIYSTLLQHHRSQQKAETQQALSSDIIKSLLQKDPKMASLLEPLLSDAQVELIFNEAKNASEE